MDGRHPSNSKRTRRDIVKVGVGAAVGAGSMEFGGAAGAAGGRATSPAASRQHAPTLLRQDQSASHRFSTWGIPAEIEAFQGIIDRYQEANPDVKIELEQMPGEGYNQQLDQRLAGGNAQDIARLQYQQVGKYSSAGALVDLSSYLEDGYSDDFEAAFWGAVLYEDKPYALPHHTDTFALFYNRDMFSELGIEPPASLDASWTWDEFIDVAKQVKDGADVQYAFAMNWQGSNGYRWMPFLFQHGGQLLTDDLSGPSINTPEGTETVAWTQSWFDEELVPPSTAVKSTEEIENLFATQTIGMMLTGDWLMPYLKEQMEDSQWGVTYMPRDVAMASDMGGNVLAVTRDSKYPDVAADFLKFAVNPDNMADFVTSATFIPVRSSLLKSELDYQIYPEYMQLFLEQATTIPEKMAQEQTIPTFAQINQALSDQLDLAFTSGQSPEDTVANLESAITDALSG